MWEAFPSFSMAITIVDFGWQEEIGGRGVVRGVSGFLKLFYPALSNADFKWQGKGRKEGGGGGGGVSELLGLY